MATVLLPYVLIRPIFWVRVVTLMNIAMKCRPLLVSPLEAMRNLLGAANVEYAVGCNVTNGEFVSLVVLSLVVLSLAGQNSLTVAC